MMNLQGYSNGQTHSYPLMKTLMAWIATIVLTALVSATLFHFAGSVSQSLLTIMLILLIYCSALRTAVVNANDGVEPSSMVNKPLLRSLVFWLAPGALGLAMMVVCMSAWLMMPQSSFPDMGMLKVLLLFWLMWTAIGQLAGRLNPNRPDRAMLTVIGIAVTLWLSVILSEMWSTENVIMPILPDMIKMLTMNPVAILETNGEIHPFVVAIVGCPVLVSLWFSYRSITKDSRAVVGPVAGLVLTTALAAVYSALNILIYHAHLGEYPCGGTWGEALRRQFITAQIPLLFAGLGYCLSLTATRDTWRNSVKSRAVRMRYMLGWALLHSAFWLSLLIPSVKSGSFCSQVNAMVVLMPLTVSLLVIAMSFLCQALRLSRATNPWLFFAIAVGILSVPVVPAAETARLPLRSLLDVVLTANQQTGFTLWICPVLMLALALACGGYLYIVARNLGVGKNAEQNGTNHSIS